MSLTALSVVWVLVFLLPEAKAAHWGVKQHAAGWCE
jgi:hypothetical protein